MCIRDSYNIILTATDKAGNQNTTNLYFTVDNTPPVLSGSVTPDTVKTNDNLIINAISGSDTELISALILDQAYTCLLYTSCMITTWTNMIIDDL